MVSSATFITITITVCAALVTCMGIVAATLNSRIGDLVTRVSTLDTHVGAKLDGIAETLARFDRRLAELEKHS